MPELSRFHGIVVYMNYNDHDPPHFHARDQGHEALVEIETGIVIGTLSRRSLRLVVEWAEIHQGELRANWARARARKPLDGIAPLP